MENSNTHQSFIAERQKPKNFLAVVTEWANDGIKRTFDILASASGLVLLLPIFFLIALRVRKDTPGPVFYRGPRFGRGGKVFQILKFRTMFDRPESDAGPRLTAQDDARITPFGRWLRKTKLNELPQLWNVLVGEMSIVGPRPEDPALAANWSQDEREEILSVRPGITSPASILYRDEESLLSSDQLLDSYLHSILPSKTRLDQLYVRNRSILLDLDTLLWTFLVLAPLSWVEKPLKQWLFFGPVSRLIR